MMEINNNNNNDNSSGNNSGSRIPFRKLKASEALEISKEINQDHIVPIQVAAKMKDVSTSAIHDAIRRGELEFFKGVSLKSLSKYRVKKHKKLSGQIAGLKRKHKKRMKAEKEGREEERE